MGGPPLGRAVFRILGQTALIEAQIDLELAATMDVDAYANPADWVITQKFDELLHGSGRHWDPHSSEIWMPEETEYTPLYTGRAVDALLAAPEYVLLSKAIKAPIKNRNLMIEFLSKLEPQTPQGRRFLELASKYGLDLEQFVR